MSQSLKGRLDKIIHEQNLASERVLVNSFAIDLGISVLDCAAALVYLHQADTFSKDEHMPAMVLDNNPKPSLSIKMVRYRLSVGIKHLITLENLKQVLVEESGVDVNNIKNVKIRDDFTLVELPDGMPPDIFQHLRTVTINHYELDIKRLKSRHKKRGGYPHRRLSSNSSQT